MEREDTQFSSSGRGKIGRIALSKNICRFELPMDMRRLEKMTPTSYIENFCRVNDRRKALYKKLFDRYKQKSDSLLGLAADKEEVLDLQNFEECLADVHMRSIDQTQIDMISHLACLTEDSKINLKLFIGLCALSERIFFDYFVTDDTIDLPDYQKDKIESADFECLDSKLFGITISPEMKALLTSI